MKTPLWAIQTNLGSTKDVAEIEAAAIRCGAEFRGLKVIPFSDDMPDVETDRPVIFYGSARFTSAIARDGRWTPGVFHDDAVLASSLYLKMWGERMVNAGAMILPLRDVVSAPFEDDEEIFIRPDADDKSFAGVVEKFCGLRVWASKICAMDDAMISAETLVLIGRAVEIQAEWRCFIIDGSCVAASQYREDGRMKTTADVPKDVIAYAEESWQEWPLMPVVAIDVARLDNGELRIVEAGRLHSTGFYAADIHSVVSAVTHASLRAWNKQNH